MKFLHLTTTHTTLQGGTSFGKKQDMVACATPIKQQIA